MQIKSLNKEIFPVVYSCLQLLCFLDWTWYSNVSCTHTFTWHRFVFSMQEADWDLNAGCVRRGVSRWVGLYLIAIPGSYQEPGPRDLRVNNVPTRQPGTSMLHWKTPRGTLYDLHSCQPSNRSLTGELAQQSVKIIISHSPKMIEHA